MVTFQPSLQELQKQVEEQSPQFNLFPVCGMGLAESLTPNAAYLKLARPGSEKAEPSFLFESAIAGEKLDRYSFIGVGPRKVIRTGNGHGPDVDPLVILEEELKQFRQAKTPTMPLPSNSGGAIGYVSYDCIRYFEPKTARDLKDPLGLPEAALMLFDTIVAFDNVYQRIQVIHNVLVDSADADLESLYNNALKKIEAIFDTLRGPEYVLPQPKVTPNDQFESNIGSKGYEDHVSRLKDHIHKGDIFQAVPSQRVAHPTQLHPFNIYRHLRTVNPSPYLIYIDYGDFQIVGASPELLVKYDKGRVITHPIAGTLPRGRTSEEDDEMAAKLLSSSKDRAEHVMLVDLARNDINRVCDPKTTNVDRLLTVERFSHVIHLVSQVSGVLREGKTRFDAFRSVFPAGTVSGAPKVRAMQLIGELEGERRGVYAGAVGHWGYDEQDMNTCIALRTMVVKDGVAYLQAGGGIVYDSDPHDEFIETVNKLGSNSTTLRQAEAIWAEKTKHL
uniref:anthranilate synthase n=1 Tax=Blastobotrys adeninivorans TaxID=409370 RepID=A0A060T4T2_BLAAD